MLSYKVLNVGIGDFKSCLVATLLEQDFWVRTKVSRVIENFPSRRGKDLPFCRNISSAIVSRTALREPSFRV